MFPLFDFLYPGYNAAERPTGEPLWVMLLSLRLPVLARSAGSPTAILLARQGCGKDLIPTGNALRASAAHSSGRISSKDLIPTGNALRASAAHSSGRISSKEETKGTGSHMSDEVKQRKIEHVSVALGQDISVAQ